MSEKQIKFYNRLLIIISIIIFLCVFLGSALSVNAAGTPAVEYPLPYVVDDPSPLQEFLTFCTYNSSSYQVYLDAFNNDNYFGYDYYEGGNHCFAFYVPQENFTYSFQLSSSYETFDYTVNRAEMIFSNYRFIKGRISVYNGRYYFYGQHDSGTVTTSTTVSFFNGTNKGDGTILVPNFSSQNYNYDNDEYKPVFGFGVPASPAPEFNTGHAVEPEDLNPIDQDWSPRPTKPNFPTIINHIWNPAPTIDTTDIQSVLESIFDILEWFAQNVSDEFNNILTNIVNLIEYIGDLIGYAVNAVIDTLVNIAKFLYDNFNELFGAFFGSFLNFFEVIHDLYQNGLDENGNFSSVALGTYLFVPEVESILDIMEQNDEYGFIDVINFLATTITGLGQYIHNVTPTHYINIPSFQIMGVTIPATVIDFSWYNNYKVVGDAIISAFLIIGYVYWLWTRLPGWFRGNSGDIFTENSSNSSDYHGTKIGF